MPPQQDTEPSTNDSTPFDPNAAHIKHTRMGAWDIYEGKDRSTFFQKSNEVLSAVPSVIRAVKTLMALCYVNVTVYLAASLVHALLPATTLYYSSQLLQVVQESIDSRNVDQALLFRILICRLSCAVVERLTGMAQTWTSVRISSKMRSHFAEHILYAHVRLDVPTYDNSAVRGQLLSSSPQSNVVWRGIRTIISVISTVIQLISQLSVLIHVLRDQPDGTVLAILSFAEPIYTWIRYSGLWTGGVWAATAQNPDYVRMEGFKALAENSRYRKELVAGNLQPYVVSEFRAARRRVGVDGDLSFMDARSELHQRRDAFSLLGFFSQPLQELPQVIFTLRAVKAPRSIPVSLASLTIIQQTVASFNRPLLILLHQASTLSETFAEMRRLYEMINVKNQVVDGTEPYPENDQTLRAGIAVEFRNVSYKYPGSENFAVRNVSFKIRAGQLCVLVGSNGSGKSTILKLLTRLYDPSEGNILIDGRDIKTLKLADLRRCISVLFQDYTHFPLSVKENIGMGDPQHAMDDDRIRQAAELGGATEIIQDLADGFDTILSRPVSDYYSGLPEGTRSLFGRPVDHGGVGRHLGVSRDVELSGGQMQRLAVSRTFMRSLGDDSDIGLLLFDEPSASLDPTAEHDLFERLRQLRGNKTMVFSSHRFGQLTRHADQIICIEKSTVLELGTHEELLKRDGGYSKMYNLQAAHFK